MNNKPFLIALLLLANILLNAQNNIGIGTHNPKVAAIVDITSLTKGLLISRTTIASVATPISAGYKFPPVPTNCTPSAIPTL